MERHGQESMETVENEQLQDESVPEIDDFGETELDAPTVTHQKSTVGGNYYSDANKIKVTIADKDAPIVILYGPPACGKTMVLVRLSRYLKGLGYTIVPDESFRDSNDSHYKEMCDDFDSIIDSDEAANSTDRISFMLVKVRSKNGKTICQILEAPGEGYYNPDSNAKSYPPYVNEILNSPNRKIFAIILEPKWRGARERSSYVDNIKRLRMRMGRGSKNKFLFVYNKIDKTDTMSGSDVPAIKDIKDNYSGVFESFKNENPITKLWKPYNCKFVRFSTGDYTMAGDHTLTYTASDDRYPNALWRNVLKLIKG